MEYFYSIQGEGFHQGKPAFFIRLAGCDVGCVWCDVKESWDENKHPRLSISFLVDEAVKSGTKIVVITGGEPLMHNLDVLTTELKKAGLQTNLETSGSHPLTGKWDWICLSPKKFKAPIAENCSVANELKVVVFNKSDFDWAEKYAALTNQDCKLYLQPEWDKSKEVTNLIVDYIQKNTKWTLSLQIHKYLNLQ